MGGEGGCVVPPSVAADADAGLKDKGAGSRSWISMDSNGQEIVLDVDKYTIIDRVQIHARDLRIIDPQLSYPSVILGRDGAIVLNLEHIKAIITSEEVLLRNPSDEKVVPIVEELRRRLKPVNPNKEDNGDDVENDSPFEFQVFEVALEAICSYLAARTVELETAVHTVLDTLTSKISSLNLDCIRKFSSRNLDCIRKLKSQTTKLTARLQKVREGLKQLLDDDGAMADLYLSRKLEAASPLSGSGAPSWSLASPSPTIGSTKHGDGNDVEELEMILEAYFSQIDGTLNKLTVLREYIDSTDDYIKIQISNRRNKLIQVEVILSAAGLCVALYSAITGIFGMNISYKWNDNHGYMFKWVVILSAVLCLSLFTVVISYARSRGLIGS